MQRGEGTMPSAIATEAAPTPIAPYAQGIDAGTHVFVSGQLGIDPITEEIAAEVSEETRQVLRNIEAVLGSAGLGMSDVVKTTIFMTDFDDYGAMNGAYAEFFGTAPPARSTVKVAGLLAGARIEIEAIAQRSG
jgi:2-iminobutanoate/2-iminopropanoate deaminase